MDDVRVCPERVKADPHAPLAANLRPERAVLGKTHPHAVPSNHAAQQVRIFIETLLNNYDEDYGDFMREVNAQLLDLKAEMAHSGGEAQAKLNEMQYYTQFCPLWEVEPTRQMLLKDAHFLLREAITHKR